MLDDEIILPPTAHARQKRKLVNLAAKIHVFLWGVATVDNVKDIAKNEDGLEGQTKLLKSNCRLLSCTPNISLPLLPQWTVSQNG